MNTKYLLPGLVIILLVWLVGGYNNLVGMSARVDQQWAQVETQYQRRFDLIPNLVKSAEAVMKQEKDIFASIAAARTQYAGSKNVDEKAQAAGNLDSALSRLLVIMENYPQIKSDLTVQKLMDELAGTENRISVERSRFNEVTTTYNVATKTVPTNILSNLFGYKEKSLYKSDEAAKIAPKVEFKN